MSLWQRIAQVWRGRVGSPTYIARGGTLLFLLVTYAVVAILPMNVEVRAELILVATTGAIYLAIMWLPLLPGKRAIADVTPALMAVGNTAWVSLAVQVLHDESPFAAMLYVIPIATSAMQYGISIGFWNMLLASGAYLAIMYFAGNLATHLSDSLMLIFGLALIAFLIGSLAQALSKQRRQFENVIAVSHEAIAIIATTGAFEFVNPATLAIGNYRAQDLIGHSIFDLVPAAERPAAQRLWRAMARRTLPEKVVNVRVVTRTGDARILATSAALLEEKPRRYLIIARDITAQETARAAHERRRLELEAERTVTEAISHTNDLQRVLHLALEQALAVLQIETGAIFLADETQTELTLAVSHGIADSILALVRPYKFGEGITGAAAAQRQVVFAGNVPNDPRVRSELRAAMQIHTQVSVPLITQDRVVGVLNLSTDKPHRLAAEDVALLRAIGATVAVAIDRARLFETLEQRVAERTEKLAALNRIAAAVSQSLQLKDISNTALAELIRTLAATRAWVRLLDPQTNTLAVFAEFGSTYSPPPALSLRLGEGISGLVARDAMPRALNVADSPLTNRADLLANGVASLAAAPLIIEGQVAGVLGVASTQRDTFGETELRWLGIVASTIAVGLKNARLFESSQQRVKQLTLLREIDHTLNSLLELEPMLEAMLRWIAEIIPYDSAAVLLREENFLRVVAARGRAHSQLLGFAFDVSHDPIFARMGAQCQPQIVGDIRTAEGWVSAPGAEFVRAWLGMPLVAREQIIGQISLYSATPHAFTREHSNVMHAFANHAAVAIANAQLREELNRQAQRDSLTQVLNHGAFLSALRAACADAQTKHEPLALIMLDLDFFKEYNDTYGHVVGDHVLTTLAQAIQAHIKASDWVGRWGGEEFCVALQNANAAHAAIVAERIRATLATTTLLDPHGACLPAPTASQGIAAIPQSARDADELIARADAALYRAKAHGRDQVVVA